MPAVSVDLLSLQLSSQKWKVFLDLLRIWASNCPMVCFVLWDTTKTVLRLKLSPISFQDFVTCLLFLWPGSTDTTKKTKATVNCQLIFLWKNSSALSKNTVNWDGLSNPRPLSWNKIVNSLEMFRRNLYSKWRKKLPPWITLINCWSILIRR